PPSCPSRCPPRPRAVARPPPTPAPPAGGRPTSPPATPAGVGPPPARGPPPSHPPPATPTGTGSIPPSSTYTCVLASGRPIAGGCSSGLHSRAVAQTVPSVGP